VDKNNQDGQDNIYHVIQLTKIKRKLIN